MYRISGIVCIDCLLSGPGDIDSRCSRRDRLLPEKNGRSVIAGIRRSEVEKSIVVKVSDSNIVDSVACGPCLFGTERAIAYPWENGDLAGICRNKIELPIVIDIGQGRLDAAITGIVAYRITERAVPVAQINEDSRIIQVGCHQIDNAIIPETACGENAGCIAIGKPTVV